MALSHAFGVREGVGEALAGDGAGWVIEPRNFWFGVPTLCKWAEGNIAGGVIRESLVDPTRSEILGTYRGLHAREPGGPMIARLVWVGVGRAGKAEVVIP